MKRAVKTEKRERPSWDEYFVNIVLETKKRSSCLKRQVGALVVSADGKTISATGYNGAPRGIKSCYDRNQCWRRTHNIKHGENKDLCRAVHAEHNAFCAAARKGVALEGGILYVTTFPCPTCANSIVQVGLVEVNYLENYYGIRHDFAERTLREAKVKMTKLEYKAS